MTSSRARAGPARSATRWVPPMSGVSPTTISTSPNWADSAAQIMSQASESSNPAVRQSPCTQASVGSGRSSRRWVISSRLAMKSSASSGVRPWNTFTSAPPVNTRPSARTSRARIGSRSASSRQATTASVSSRPKRLSGGSSITRTPRSPSRSKRARSAIPKLPGHLGELALADVHRLARELEGIVLVTRDHVYVEVEDRLPGRALARVDEVHPVAIEGVAGPKRHALGGVGGPGQVVVIDVVEVARVPARDHERVAPGPGVEVHERQRVLVLVDDLGGGLARRDLAEDAVVVGQGREA